MALHTQTRTARHFASLALALAAVTVPSFADGYCRTTTFKVPKDYNSASSGCVSEGLPVWWRNACVGYSVAGYPGRQVSYDAMSLLATRAFTFWTSVACPTNGRGVSRVSIDVRDVGPTECRQIGTVVTGKPNQNVIFFQDEVWPHDDVENTLGLTTISFNANTGELYGADMEINGVGKLYSASDPVPADGYDLLSVLTHEAGHFLGIAHSQVRDSTMFAQYDPGSTQKRNLTADDVDALCNVYTPSGYRNVATTVTTDGKMPNSPCDPTPRGGFSTKCADAIAQAPRCAMGAGTWAGNASPDRGGFPAFALVAFVAAARRRSLRRSRGRGSFV